MIIDRNCLFLLFNVFFPHEMIKKKCVPLTTSTDSFCLQEATKQLHI